MIIYIYIYILYIDYRERESESTDSARVYYSNENFELIFSDVGSTDFICIYKHRNMTLIYHYRMNNGVHK